MAAAKIVTLLCVYRLKFRTCISLPMAELLGLMNRRRDAIECTALPE